MKNTLFSLIIGGCLLSSTPSLALEATPAATPVKPAATPGAKKKIVLLAPGIPEGVDKLADLILAALPQKGMAPANIVVTPFINLGPTVHEKKLGEIVAELLVTKLSEKPNLKIIERAQVNAILEEMKLSMLGLTDGANAGKVGQMLGADAIIVGSVSEVGDKFSITARHVSVATGQVLFAKEVRIPQAGAIALSSKYVVTKSRSDSLFRSLLIPGWGQMYNNQEVKGYIFTGVTLGLIGAGLYQQTQYNKTHDAYLKSTSQAEADELYEKQVDQKSQSQTILFAIVPVVWGLNVVDAFLNGTSASDVRISSEEPKVSAAISERSDGTRVAAVSLRF